ncbi:class I SAM-dependent methyltransferase [Clostridium beijerinckii]|jgi:ubiquinone/menaquinone biosynthesis C-methylase UbiE|uniref:Class I SAM-dependent methyltransferase n=1 Tax=Clostridium beijerinckii TaxID=1520 RepID=A0AAW3W5D8_CLOBE|nr:class I SAM-dependent methyltransferase [Clostridium beijerinckii]MBC2456677.1 class I SAM-dependent methyltransferase [Clostridium beijerinckii]MBC2473977.1 class I SAM-dependent methyltransferase [Clostridium beijerinckii]MCI1578058.1 class I SAM-dependent methyltransferase [Clostridium beijerinckii]MCI1583059.1 class I SAM-dependent methyltransferase [Clostridium beijerinckii]MCI1620815.1 class I SAM-dependent methyltransferase [Clostridium beijerinckii]
MNEIFRQIPLYRFIMFCNEATMDKVVLDCGAGGNCPPLSLFSEYGYKTYGIEFDINQLKEANMYADKKNQDLNIEHGDMRNLKFEDETFSFVYSYNSVFHMRKEDVLKSINEMKRVLKPGGLLFVNFLTTKDSRYGTGLDIGENQYEQMERNTPVIHSYLEECEPDTYFEDMEILHKEIRVLERLDEGEKIRQGFVDYIVKKI